MCSEDVVRDGGVNSIIIHSVRSMPPYEIYNFFLYVPMSALSAVIQAMNNNELCECILYYKSLFP